MSNTADAPATVTDQVADQDRAPAPEREPSTIWASREYRAWFTGDLLQDLGAGIAMFAFPLVCLAVTGSPVHAGTVGFFQGAGTLLGILPGGVLADRHNRRTLRLVSSGLGVLAQLALVALLLTGTANVANLAALAFLDRLRNSLLSPASNSMLKQVVPGPLLPNAVAANQGRDAAVTLATGPAGGALLAIHLYVPALAQIIGQLASMVATLRMRGDYRPGRSGGDECSGRAGCPENSENSASSIRTGRLSRALAEFNESLRWIWDRTAVRVFLICACLLNLGWAGMMMSVTLGLADRGVEPALIGLLATALGCGALAGAVVAAKVVARVPSGVLIVAGFLMCAGVVALVPFLPGLGWIGAVYALMGLIIPAVNAAVMGLVTLMTPNELMGRVGSVSQFFSSGAAAFAPALAGWGIGTLGWELTQSAFALPTALAAFAMLASAQVRRIPASPQWESYLEESGSLRP
ncbi:MULTISPECIES: MFS transporter [Actinotignum]|uniref:MFS transporter n=1 Tax=Actinotignum timonense TaxID=1870995 RepID=A0AAW9HJ51_9ACTO|nr:MFS transporter [Actinotignum timonense]MDY5140511.1 MFS transporter [Actinotignum timonense]MDY5156427.1 MFS transporter [Actinotignum timonense]